jgi:hypothetical protein
VDYNYIRITNIIVSMEIQMNNEQRDVMEEG